MKVMPTVLEKLAKSLGRWHDASLSDKSQIEDLRQEGVQVNPRGVRLLQEKRGKW